MWAGQLTRHKIGNTIQRTDWLALWATWRGKPVENKRRGHGRIDGSVSYQVQWCQYSTQFADPARHGVQMFGRVHRDTTRESADPE